MRGIVFDYESKRYLHLVVYNAMHGFYIHFQKSSTINNVYLEAHQNLRDVTQHCGGKLTSRKTLTHYTLDAKEITQPQPDDTKKAEAKAKEAHKAVAFLCGLHKERCQDLLDQLANAFLVGRDEYPNTLVKVYNLGTNWQGSSNQPRLKRGNSVTFNAVVKKDDEDKSGHNKNTIVRSKTGRS